MERSSAGAVPYSSVTSVTNMTKEYSYYLIEAGVSYREDVDEVIEVLKEIDEGLRADRPGVQPPDEEGVRRRGIEIPFPHRTVFFGEGKDGSAPPLRLRSIEGKKPDRAAGIGKEGGGRKESGGRKSDGKR